MILELPLTQTINGLGPAARLAAGSRTVGPPVAPLSHLRRGGMDGRGREPGGSRILLVRVKPRETWRPPSAPLRSGVSPLQGWSPGSKPPDRFMLGNDLGKWIGRGPSFGPSFSGDYFPRIGGGAQLLSWSRNSFHEVTDAKLQSPRQLSEPSSGVATSLNRH